ncbi:MAG: CCA tRNA nucleotidyltransferase [Clostridia bacterium]|nr:CCA tRNA nucleotidyltransferase [Clostridia bacterium]
MRDHITPNLLKLAKLFKKKGELFIVGGYVRNALLGIYETDIDLASKLTNEEIKEILFGTKYEIKETSKKLGTLTISLGEEKWEHSTFRTEEYPEGGSHTPKNVQFVTTVEEDSKRRDFSANCIYYNILKDEYVDLYGGKECINKRLLKSVGVADEVFRDDGVRILRMIRIASELGFRIAGETILSAYGFRENLADVSGARKLQELNAILYADKRYKISRPNAFMFGLQMFNLLRLWPYFNAPVYKVHFKLTSKVKSEYRMYALVADIIETTKYKLSISEIVKDLLGSKGLCFAENKIENYKHIVCGYFDALAKLDNKTFFMEYFNDFKIIAELLEKRSKKLFKKYNFYYNYLINNKIPIRIKDLKITGADLKQNFPKLKEKNYNEILTKLLDAVFDGRIKNEKKDLLEATLKLI